MNINRPQHNDKGFAAIVVTLIVMSIVVLISVGFVRIVSREQRASIDRQLSTQAFYAAETGVNDAAENLKDQSYLDSLGSTGKEDCDVSDTSLWAPVLDESIEYTCVLIDPEPADLVYDSITSDVRVIILRAEDSNGNEVAIGGLDVEWQAEPEPENPNFVSFGTDFPTSWPSGAGVLRGALTPLSNVDRDSLIENTFTVFLRPYSGSPVTASSPPPVNTLYAAGDVNIDGQGRILQVPCNADTEPMFCRARINGLGASEGYLMTVRSIYENSSLRLSSTNGESFKGEQAVVDSTGRASDVLRRIQTRLRLRDDYAFPGFALQVGNNRDEQGGACKSYTFYPGVGNPIDGRCAY